MLLNNFSVLVVDDVILMCDFLYGVAAKIPGCRAYKALDGETAANILETKSIDVLITDLEMKAPTGLELVSRVRSGRFSSTAHNIPIIIFSGNTFRDLIQQSVRLDVNDFIAKPSTSDVLSRKIMHHLRVEKPIKNYEYYAALSHTFANQSKPDSVLSDEVMSDLAGSLIGINPALA